MRSTIVLVHADFAESASWDGVIEPLMAEVQRHMTQRRGRDRSVMP